MVRLAHISDLHFGRIDEAVMHGLTEMLQILQLDCVILSGDLTQRARDRQYREAGQFLEKLPVPYLVVPGNHDVSATNLPERFLYPWRKWMRTLPVSLEPTMALAQTAIVGINTARCLTCLFDWTRGVVSAAQLARIQDSFKKFDPTYLKILVAHHPFWLPERFAARHLVYGRDEALRQFSREGPDLILSGHVHVPSVAVRDGIVIVNAGTACSNRLVVDSPNSFNVVSGNRENIEIQPYHWDGAHFQAGLTSLFQRTVNGWQQLDKPEPEVVTGQESDQSEP